MTSSLRLMAGYLARKATATMKTISKRASALHRDQIKQIVYLVIGFSIGTWCLLNIALPLPVLPKLPAGAPITLGYFRPLFVGVLAVFGCMFLMLWAPRLITLYIEMPIRFMVIGIHKLRKYIEYVNKNVPDT